MNKKITRLYLSLLVFLLSFFAIYSQRFVVYDYLNTHYKYSDTLSKEKIKEAKAYLDEQEQVDFMNHTQIRKDLNQLLKKGSYQVILYKTKSNKPDDKVIDSILSFCGRTPLKNAQKYNIFIKSSSKMSCIEWYPSFTNYYHSYRIFDCILSLIITILFYLLLKNLKPLRSKKNVFYSLSSRMMFSFLCATLLVLTSFSFLYLNRSAVFEFLMDTFYQSEDYSSYVKKLEKQLQNFDLTKENKKVINHILKENGRLGIILSNSLASVEKWSKAREWFMKKMRVVALFDLPSNVFADTGVNTTIIVAYKPTEEKLNKLISEDYSIFVKDIKKVGYTVKTSNRVKYFDKIYKLDNKYETMVDNEGNPIIDEEFSNVIEEFKNWCLKQEKDLQDIFL